MSVLPDLDLKSWWKPPMILHLQDQQHLQTSNGQPPARAEPRPAQAVTEAATESQGGAWQPAWGGCLAGSPRKQLCPGKPRGLRGVGRGRRAPLSVLRALETSFSWPCQLALETLLFTPLFCSPLRCFCILSLARLCIFSNLFNQFPVAPKSPYSSD